MDLTPEHPHDAGIEEQIPDSSRIEGAETLANAARSILGEQGFTDDEINEWALTYISLNHSGDLGSFLQWVSDKEHGR
ncbi:MAG: hypothetical protein M5U23_13400 [Acidimicrobiia bacterium]|nr:hypothetical protein [Acidimicrobiia bacterium]